jgi:hypothetical protein
MYTQKNITASADNVQCILYNENCWHICNINGIQRYEQSKKVIGFHMLSVFFLFSLSAIGKQNSKHFAGAVLKIERFERLGNKNPTPNKFLIEPEVDFLDVSPSWTKAQIGELRFPPCLLSLLCLATEVAESL